MNKPNSIKYFAGCFTVKIDKRQKFRIPSAFMKKLASQELIIEKIYSAPVWILAPYLNLMIKWEDEMLNTDAFLNSFDNL